MTNKTITIDATGQTIGRVATKISIALRGKDTVAFARNLVPAIKVEVVNASKLKLDARKLKAKSYSRYSGYPGGLKSLELEKLIAKKGYAEPLRLAVRGMLPTNKLRAKLLTNLTINE